MRKDNNVYSIDPQEVLFCEIKEHGFNIFKELREVFFVQVFLSLEE